MSQKVIRTVLVIEDNPGDARLLREMLQEQGSDRIELTHVECMSDAEMHLAHHAVDIILLDLALPDVEGLGGVQRAQAAVPHVPLVVLTGLDDEALAAQALQEGAQDYLIKGEIGTRGLLRAMRYAVERKILEQLKDGFVSSVSHELRTPLTSISASLSLLMVQASGILPDRLAHLLTIANTNCQRLVRLVNDILDIEKMESGQVAFNFRQVGVRSLVKQVIDTSCEFAESCSVQIRLEEARDVCDVRADPDRLAQVVTNLLSNAIKFSPAGNEVVVSIENGIDVVRISVRDHGPGISIDFKPRIFGRFAQADATNARRKGGTGLGLSIVKQIVERLSGKVEFADAPGGGTVFHVELPCWRHVAMVAIDFGIEPDALRILLCDGNPEAAGALREQLKVVGFVLDIAHAAGDALTCAVTTQYHAILVDLQLPDGDGISLILRLRELPQYYETPIIVVSADPGRGRNDLRSSKLNVLDWLNKPVHFDQLLQLLTKPAVLPNESKRPLILHIDQDNTVAHALREIAEVVSINSIDEARRALEAKDFDLAVLNVALATRSGLDLLQDLRDSKGRAIPVVLLSAEGANLATDRLVQGAPIRPHAPIDSLVATVCERLASYAHASKAPV
jgi:signal transduction histidine kinase